VEGHQIETNCTPYFDRGWCFFELIVAILFGTCQTWCDKLEEKIMGVLHAMVAKQNFRNDNHRKKAAIILRDAVRQKMSPIIEKQTEKFVDDSIFAEDLCLVKLSFLKELVAGGRLIVRRQEVPQDKIGNHKTHTQSGGKCFVIVYTSHGKGSGHTDPKGVVLKHIVSRLTEFGADDDDLICWDYCAVYKEGDGVDDRTPAQKESAARGMATFNKIFGDARFRTLVITAVREGGDPLASRGFPLVQIFTSAFAGCLILDDPEVVDIFVEKWFMLTFEDKKFTNGKTDKPLVAKLFRTLMYEHAGMDALDDSLQKEVDELKKQMKERDSEIEKLKKMLEDRGTLPKT
jgi:hypothetical protein